MCLIDRLETAWKIYVLKEPLTHEVRYVGFTRLSLDQRLKRHLRESRDMCQCHKCRWLRTLNQLPIIHQIESVSKDSWAIRERYWIAHYRQTGRLTNLSNGGETIVGYEITEETRRKLSVVGKGRRMSQESRLIMSRLAKVRGVAMLHTIEARKKASESLKGLIKISEEGRQRLRVFHTGKTLSEETKKKISAAKKGVKSKPEHVEARREAIRATWLTPAGEERREWLKQNGIGSRSRGTKLTLAAKEKIRQSWIRRKEKWGKRGSPK